MDSWKWERLCMQVSKVIVVQKQRIKELAYDTVLHMDIRTMWRYN
jgi:hypothetical protein